MDSIVSPGCTVKYWQDWPSTPAAVGGQAPGGGGKQGQGGRAGNGCAATAGRRAAAGITPAQGCRRRTPPALGKDVGLAVGRTLTGALDHHAGGDPAGQADAAVDLRAGGEGVGEAGAGGGWSALAAAPRRLASSAAGPFAPIPAHPRTCSGAPGA